MSQETAKYKFFRYAKLSFTKNTFICTSFIQSLSKSIYGGNNKTVLLIKNEYNEITLESTQNANACILAKAVQMMKICPKKLDLSSAWNTLSDKQLTNDNFFQSFRDALQTNFTVTF